MWFRCFKGKHNSEAYSLELIKEGIVFCYNLFKDKDYHLIFLADRWFPHVEILTHIKSLGCFYCIRAKSYFTYGYYNEKKELVTKHLRDIKPISQRSKIVKDVLFTRKKFKTTIVVPTYNNHPEDTWYIVTNDDPHYATKNYSYRFGSIECIFKSQKSNGFRLESTNTKILEHFISLFTIMCIALTWLTILGADYVRKKNCYQLKIRDVRTHKGHKPTRLYSLFNLGLTIFNICYYNDVNFKLKFNFVLYDV